MQQTLISKVKRHVILPVAALMLFTIDANAKTDRGDTIPSLDERRVELKLKQRHSGVVPYDNVYADGIKIHRDLSILKHMQAQRLMEEWEIPADDLYQGVWANRGVATAYYSIEPNMPDSFMVDLSNFTMPSYKTDKGHVTSKFGLRKWRMHYGVDIKVNIGDTIVAAFDGKVRVKQYERRGYGYYLVIRHPNGLETVYGHLSKFLVDEEQVVKSGEPIALGGNTGRSSGSHLHLEFRFVGKAIDPTLIVDVPNRVCHRDEFLVTNNVLSNAKTVYTASSGGFKYYRVKSGDTLGGIAYRNQTTIGAICAMNGISTKTLLRIGRPLKVPSKGGKAPAQPAATTTLASTNTSASSKPTTRTRSVTPTQNAAPARTNAGVVGKPKNYKVKAGDTLTSIARRSGISIATLCAMNNDMDPNTVLALGKSMKVPSSMQNSGASAPVQSAVFHNVASGETLSSIARKYNTTIAKICSINNNLDPNSILRLGQELKVPTINY